MVDPEVHKQHVLYTYIYIYMCVCVCVCVCVYSVVKINYIVRTMKMFDQNSTMGLQTYWFILVFTLKDNFFLSFPSLSLYLPASPISASLFFLLSSSPFPCLLSSNILRFHFFSLFNLFPASIAPSLSLFESHSYLINKPNLHTACLDLPISTNWKVPVI